MTLLAAGAFFYRGVQRWDFGLGNPNKAAAVLACLLVLIAGFSLYGGGTGRTRLDDWRRRLAPCCGALATLAGYALARTFSRGGIVAFLAGAAVLAAGSRRKRFGLRRWIPMLLAAAAIAYAAALTGFAGRMARSLPSADASVGNRLAIWRSVPAMMADAPGGWGAGNAGDAFMGWYQPLDASGRYRTLVNSHFTRLVETGWAGRLCYVFGLALLFGMGVVRMKVRGDPVPLAVFACFAASAFFSSVAEEWLACAVPLALAPPVLKTFVFEATARARLAALAAAVFAGVALPAALAAAGVAYRPAGTVPLHRSFDGTRLVIGEGEPSAWVVCDHAAMGGSAFGRRLRGFAAAPEGRGRAYGLASDLASVPDGVHRLVLCGKAADAGPGALARFRSLSDVRAIAPARPGEWLAARAQKPFIRVFCGEFADSCPDGEADGLTVVAGAAGYIPDWPRLAFAP